MRWDRQVRQRRPGGNMKRRWMLIALLGIMAAAQAADAYRWVDASGVVHYSDAPPPQEAKAELVHLHGTGSTTAASIPTADDSAIAEDSGDAPAKKPPGTLASSVQNAEKRCADARANLEVLQRSGPVGLSTGTGKPQPLDDHARQQQISNAQTIIATYCK
jgi:Domain of unknown function (DUF4124)